MKPSQVFESLKILKAADLPCILWGPPGVGKSCIMQQLVDWLNAIEGGDHKLIKQKAKAIPEDVIIKLMYGFLDIRALLLDPVDLRGLPSINGDQKAHWCPPAFLPTSGKGIIFFDELPSAPPLTQNALLQLFLDRKIGEYTLPPGWWIVAAGNREIDRAFTHRMSTPMANRLIHINYDVDQEDWISWAYQADIYPMVIAFIYNFPHLLLDFDPMNDSQNPEKKNEKAFASPRTWEFASDILKQNPPKDLKFELLSGTIGQGPTGEFMTFEKVYNELPDMDNILAHPKTADVPKGKPDIMYSLTCALASLAEQDNFKNIVTYAMRIEKEWSMKLMKDIVRKDPMLMKHKSYTTQWFPEHGAYLQ